MLLESWYKLQQQYDQGVSEIQEMPKIRLEIRLCLPLVTIYSNYPFIQMTGFKEGKQSNQTAFNWFRWTKQ